MRRHLVIALVVAPALLPSWSARAAEKKVVLDIKNASCILCPPIVRDSLTRVPGVTAVEMKQADPAADLLATVTFDDALTTVTALAAATTNAGYPTQIAN